METRGDYPAALRLFEQIAKGSDRNLAARSLLYAGLCYEKLGKREAQNAYERLIRDFADQSGLVTAARARLAALTPPEALRPPGRWRRTGSWRTSLHSARSPTTANA